MNGIPPGKEELFSWANLILHWGPSFLFLLTAAIGTYYAWKYMLRSLVEGQRKHAKILMLIAHQNAWQIRKTVELATRCNINHPDSPVISVEGYPNGILGETQED